MIQNFVEGMHASAYATNLMAQAALERKFEVIGEALNRLSKLDATLACRVSDLPRIMAFRNQPIHGHANVDVGTVCTVVRTALPVLIDETRARLDELSAA